MLVGAVPVCPPVSPHEGASVGKCTNMFWCEQTLSMNRNAAFADGACSLRMETPSLRVRIYPLQMETPLRGRSGGHTGAAPTISRMVLCYKIAGE